MNRRKFLNAGFGASLLSALSGTFPVHRVAAQNRTAAESLNLKITDLKTFVVNTPGDENFVFVKVYTNQGIVGLGEGTMTAKALTVEQAILEHKRYLVGKDPTDIERHWQSMFRGPRYRGGPILMTSISAIEIALWDILGQALGQPIWRLLGGKARDKVRIYRHPLKDRSAPGADRISREEFVERWVHTKEAGWTACKDIFLPAPGGVMNPARSVQEGIARLQAVRKAVGEDFDICVELHGRATTTMAVEFCRRAEPYRPYFVEEATQQEDLGELALLRSKSAVPLATGERLFTKYAFSEMCARHLVDFVQPDVIHCGGIAEMKKIGTIAEAFRIEMAPHNPQSEVSTMASLHVNLCTPNATILEIGSGQSEIFSDLFYGGAVRFEKGYALPPDKPGLGIALNEQVAAKFPYQAKDWSGRRFPDGAIADR